MTRSDKWFFLYLAAIQAVLVLLDTAFVDRFFLLNFVISSFVYAIFVLITNRLVLSAALLVCLSTLLFLVNKLKVYYCSTPLIWPDFIYISLFQSIFDVIRQYFGSFRYFAITSALCITFVLLIWRALRVKKDYLIQCSRMWSAARLCIALPSVALFIYTTVISIPDILAFLQRHNIDYQQACTYDHPHDEGGTLFMLATTITRPNTPTKDLAGDSTLIQNKAKQTHHDKRFARNNIDTAPDIILILNESAFPSSLLKANIPPQPSWPGHYTKNLQTHTFAGGTWRSTLNVLSGVNLALLPAITNIKSLTSSLQNSLPDLLKNDGYNTYFLTDSNKEGALTFKNASLALPEFWTSAGHRWGIKRDADYFQAIVQLLRKQSNRPNFVYLETSYLHGPYGKDYSGSDIAQCNKAYPTALCDQLNDYLTKKREVDQDMEEVLFQYIKHTKRKTLLITFGDHQPGFGGDNNKRLLKEGVSLYTTLYSIYSNYHVNPATLPDNMDIIFLPGLLLDLAGINHSDYYQTNSYVRKRIYEDRNLTDEEQRSFEAFVLAKALPTSPTPIKSS